MNNARAAAVAARGENPRVVATLGGRVRFETHFVSVDPRETGRKGASGQCTGRRRARGAPPGPSARTRGTHRRVGAALAWGCPGHTETRAPPRFINRSDQRCEPRRTVKHGRRRSIRAEGGQRAVARGRGRDCNPFVLVKCGGEAEQTHVVNSSQNPEWTTQSMIFLTWPRMTPITLCYLCGTRTLGGGRMFH